MRTCRSGIRHRAALARVRDWSGRTHMPGMKVTVDAAMRARDVSRPHSEHEALADAAEPQPGRGREQGQTAPEAEATGSVAAAAAATAARGAAPGGTSKARSARRRRGRHLTQPEARRGQARATPDGQRAVLVAP